MSSPCATCNCPADGEWLPCTTECLQEERLWRLRSREEYIPLPPLPVSDDECDCDSDSYVSKRAEEDVYTLTEPFDLPGWIESPKSEAYRKSIGHLVNFPHILHEAELIYGLLSENINTAVDLIYALYAINLPRCVFARSIPASVRWHISKMLEVGVIKVSTN